MMETKINDNTLTQTARHAFLLDKASDIRGLLLLQISNKHYVVSYFD